MQMMIYGLSLIFFFSGILAQEDLISKICSEQHQEHIAGIQKLVQETSEFQQKLVPQLLDSLTTENADHRRKIVCALAKIGPEAESAIPRLIQLIQDPNEQVRKNVPWALGEIGVASKENVLSLIELLSHPEEYVRISAIEAIGALKIKDQTTVETLLPFLKLPSVEIRKVTVIALGKMGDPAAIPALSRTLNDEEEEIRNQSTEAIQKLLKSSTDSKQ